MQKCPIGSLTMGHVSIVSLGFKIGVATKLWVENALKVSKDDGTPIRSRTNLRESE